MPPPNGTYNTFRGPRALHDYYDPDISPPTPLVELPRCLNPFYDDGVHVFAKLHSALPAGNVKSLPALNMLREAGADPAFPATNPEAKPFDRIVEYSSGSTATSLGLLSSILSLSPATAYLSNKTTPHKLRLLQFFGLHLRLFGGPSQPLPHDPRGGIRAAAEAALQPGTVHLNQYENTANYRAHQRWTAKQVALQLDGEVDVFAAGMGTSGTMTGTGMGLRRLVPYCFRVGVTTQPGDRVPGPRSEELLEPVEFPWREAIDAMEWVGSKEAYEWSLKLCRKGILAGPSSGFALSGLYNRLATLRAAGQLDSLRHRSPHGDESINAVFLCCDGPLPYLDEYFDKLPAASFPPVENGVLSEVDLYRYSDGWEVDSRFFRPLDRPNKSGSTGMLRSKSVGSVAESESEASVGSDGSDEGYSSPATSDEGHPDPQKHDPTAKADRGARREDTRPAPLVLDLRDPVDFEQWHYPHSLNLALESLSSSIRSRQGGVVSVRCPFAEADVLERQWSELDAVFGPGAREGEGARAEVVRRVVGEEGRKGGVVVVCYGGNTARVATSVLRRVGVRAWSLKGGVCGLGSER